jgi:hypothetical protein
MNKLLPAFSCLALGLIMCQPSSGAQSPTTTGGSTGGTGGGGVPCSSDQDCGAALDAGNCFYDAGMDAGGFCELCATNPDCAPLGTNFVCTEETCIPGADAGPAAGHCNVSCECASGKACEETLCTAPPTMCEADTDCPCNAVCESHNCLLNCNPDAGNSDCANPTPKCYSSFGRCGFCTAATDCPTGQTCLPSGSCGVAQASTTGTTSGSTSSPIGGLIGSSGSIGGIIGGSSPIGGIIGGTSPIGGIIGGTSPIGGILGGSSGGSSSSGGITTCDTTSCGGCSSSDVCYCPTLTIPPVACVPTAGCGGSGLPGICGPSLGGL